MRESLWNSEEVSATVAGSEEGKGGGGGTRERGGGGAPRGAVQGAADPTSSAGVARAAGGRSSQA